MLSFQREVCVTVSSWLGEFLTPLHIAQGSLVRSRAPGGAGGTIQTPCPALGLATLITQCCPLVDNTVCALKELLVPSQWFASSLVWTPCRGRGAALASQSSAALAFPGNTHTAKQAHAATQDSAHDPTGKTRAVLCCLHTEHGGQLLQLLERAREDLLLKASRTCSCLPDAPSQVATGLVVAPLVPLFTTV